MGTRVKVLAACWIGASVLLLSGVSQGIGRLGETGFVKEQAARLGEFDLSPSIEISVDITLNLAR